MSKHLIIPGDFLKNAGIVGLYYMLKSREVLNMVLNHMKVDYGWMKIL